MNRYELHKKIDELFTNREELKEIKPSRKDCELWNAGAPCGDCTPECEDFVPYCVRKNMIFIDGKWYE